ncbi:hypothetical protein PUN28_007194 [Cardiocondyla obscurior]|uniref:Uncharacterized protein n=1 Tax=Cardiocondyla obscurior TaxID=286306 RepID=A0AAW2G210_9HYME
MFMHLLQVCLDRPLAKKKIENKIMLKCANTENLRENPERTQSTRSISNFSGKIFYCMTILEMRRQS